MDGCLGDSPHLPSRVHSDREFRFGDGPRYRSLGEINLPITIPKERTDDKQNHIVVFQVDIVKATAPLLISQQALPRMQGRVDFCQFTLELPGRFTIALTKSSTGHVLLPGIITQQTLARRNYESLQVFPVQQIPPERRVLADAQVMKIHKQLGHCSEKQLTDLIKFGGCIVGEAQILRVNQRCGCQRSVHRITPPVVSSWIDRFSGEVVAIDVIRPFMDIGPEGLFPKWKATGEIPALIAIDSLTRFITCQILKSANSETASRLFVNDWVKHFGKPKKDHFGPGKSWAGRWRMGNVESHLWMTIHPSASSRRSPKRTSRTFRSVAEGRCAKYSAK